jgi:MoxR-like ATPase
MGVADDEAAIAAADEDLGQRLNRDVLTPMKEMFVGKDEVIDLLGVCLVGGENLFILGPPGTAKSALVQELALRLEGRMFDYLLTRFTEPNELFGPFDIRKLREGELVTNTDGMLPLADFVFLDELLNANSAILNSLLMVLNERIFRRGRETFSLPTLMVVGASNSLPQDEALGALFDRFLLRVRCDNVPTERLSEVLREVDLSPVQASYVDLVRRLRMAGIKISDRRAVKLQRMMAASALLCGRRQAITSDMWVLRHIWDTDEQQEVIAAQVDNAITSAGGADQPGSHPRANRTDAPNPEVLGSELRRISARLDDPALDSAEKSQLRDELSLLAARCEWVANAHQREFLQQEVQSLWPRV